MQNSNISRINIFKTHKFCPIGQCSVDWSIKTKVLEHTKNEKIKGSRKFPVECDLYSNEIFVVDNLWETIDMNSLRKYASQNIDVNQPKLEEFVSYVDSVGIEVKDGIKKIEVSYHRIKGIGRRYAGKYSMQRHSRAARKAAFEKIGHDIDMVNAGFSILSLLLQENNLIDKFPMIDSLRKNPFLCGKSIFLWG